MQINRIDHLVLTVADIERTVDFYQRVLGMQRIEFADGRVALRCGAQKINLHQLVVHAVNKVTLSRSTIVFGKARSAGKTHSTRCARGAGPGMPFPRSATQSKNDCAAALREWLCGRDSALCFLTRACHCLRNTP